MSSEAIGSVCEERSAFRRVVSLRVRGGVGVRDDLEEQGDGAAVECDDSREEEWVRDEVAAGEISDGFEFGADADADPAGD